MLDFRIPFHKESQIYRLLCFSLLLVYPVVGFTNPRCCQTSRVLCNPFKDHRFTKIDSHLHEQNRSLTESSPLISRKSYPRWEPLSFLLLASFFQTVTLSWKRQFRVAIASKIASTCRQLHLSWILAIGFMIFQGYGVILVSKVQNLLQQSLSLYVMYMVSSPIITKSVSVAIIGFFGDFLAQRVENWLMIRERFQSRKEISKKSPFTYDLRRGVSILTGGLFVSGPLMHVGYNWFEHLLPVNGSFAALVHLLADMIFLDSLSVALTFVITGIMEGYDIRKFIIPQLKRDYVSTVRASWITSIILMPVGFLCFRCLPLTWRTVAMSITDIIWDGIVSFMAHRDRHSSQESY
jgi:Mpv17 / PMP22 family